ncbi:MAG: DUF4097 family beta strand repeat protein [Clostridia bacterium]|nr:DUF4097 family beta strand repeat protein [Clostridia bacterium]
MKTKIKVILFALIAALLLVAIGVGMYHTLPYRYDNAENYQRGDTAYEDLVTAIQIHWINGFVTLERHDGHEILIRETDAPAEEGQQVHSNLKDGVLDIRYCKNGALSTGARKQLTVLLPEGLMIDLSVTSQTANVMINGGSYGNVNVHNTTGLTRFYHATVENVTGVTDSGDVNFSGEMKTGKFETVSGNHALQYTVQPQELAFYSVDGEMQLTLPKDSTFKAAFYTKDGSLSTAFKGNIDKNVLTVGENPAYKYDFVTVSGDLKLNKK